jgi:transposase
MQTRIRLHYRVREKLVPLCRGGTPVRIAKRARVLLCLNEGKTVEKVADLVGCGTATVKRVRRHYLEEGWERAVFDAPRPGRPKKLASREEQELIALACSDPPEGEGRWTVRLLAKHSGRDISRNIVQRVLKEDGLKPWREKNVVRAGARRRVPGTNV